MCSVFRQTAKWVMVCLIILTGGFGAFAQEIKELLLRFESPPTLEALQQIKDPDTLAPVRLPLLQDFQSPKLLKNPKYARVLHYSRLVVFPLPSPMSFSEAQDYAKRLQRVNAPLLRYAMVNAPVTIKAAQSSSSPNFPLPFCSRSGVISPTIDLADASSACFLADSIPGTGMLPIFQKIPINTNNPDPWLDIPYGLGVGVRNHTIFPNLRRFMLGEPEMGGYATYSFHDLFYIASPLAWHHLPKIDCQALGLPCQGAIYGVNTHDAWQALGIRSSQDRSPTEPTIAVVDTGFLPLKDMNWRTHAFVNGVYTRLDRNTRKNSEDTFGMWAYLLKTGITTGATADAVIGSAAQHILTDNSNALIPGFGYIWNTAQTAVVFSESQAVWDNPAFRNGWMYPDRSSKDPNTSLGGQHGLGVAAIAAEGCNDGVFSAGVTCGGPVLPIRALDDTDWNPLRENNVAGILEALWYLNDLRKPGGPLSQGTANPLRVVNLSNGLNHQAECEFGYAEILQNLYDNNVSVVVSAGNDSSDADQFSPSNCPHVLVVGATNFSGAPADYTNRGRSVSLMAPGGDWIQGMSPSMQVLGGEIPVPRFYIKTSNTGLTSEPWSLEDAIGQTMIPTEGTSFSAPLVSGALALLYRANPDLNVDQARTLLVETAQSFPSTPLNPLDGRPQTACTPDVCGAGILDIGAAVRKAQRTGTAVQPTPERTPKPFDPLRAKAYNDAHDGKATHSSDEGGGSLSFGFVLGLLGLWVLSQGRVRVYLKRMIPR